MSKQFFFKRPTIVFSLSIFFMLSFATNVNLKHASVAAAPIEDKCATVTKEDLVKEIYEKIMVKYSGQKSHINVSVKDNIVYLDGWASPKGVKKEIEKIAKKTKCVKKVMNGLGNGPGGCTRQQQRCGDACIPGDRECTL